MAVHILRRLRHWVQAGVFLLFILLFLGTRADGAPLLPADTFFRLDPLAALTASVAGRWLIGGLLLSLAVIVLTLLSGRSWCAWLCPLGTVLDLVGPRRSRGAGLLAPAWRGVKYAMLIVILAAALLGNLTLMVLDPLTLLTRTMSVSIFPTVDATFTALTHALYPVPFLQRPVIWLEGALRGPIFPYEPFAFPLAPLFTLLFAGILALNWVSYRFWCRYLCPLGALLGFASRFAWLRRRVNDRCISCQRCAVVCPTGTIDAETGFASDPAECIMCLDCHPTCPAGAIDFAGSRPWPATGRPYDPSRRQALGALAIGIAGVSLAQVAPAADRTRPHLILPPGGRENRLEEICIRCGLCLKVCPTGGLQPAWEHGIWTNAWTPVLVPRLGHCDYSCNACGQICPTGAIPPIELSVKRTVVMGKAYFDHDRCIPWADKRSCLVCEEMCPVPDKAIKLDPLVVTDERGEQATIGLPRVERERCIGCGHCESYCPVSGPAAIRVYTPDWAR